MGKVLLNKLFLKQAIRKIEMLNNNKTSLILIKDPESQNRTKYINMTDTPLYTRSNRKKRTRN